MPKEYEDFIDDEDECCLNCGEIDYTPSKTMGLCLECFADPNRVFEDDQLYSIDESDAF